MRISDWSSDVCSSDLAAEAARVVAHDVIPHHFRAVLRNRERIALGCAAEAVAVVGQRNLRRILLGRVVIPLRIRGAAPRRVDNHLVVGEGLRSEEHTSELQSLMRISYAVFCLKKKTKQHTLLS